MEFGVHFKVMKHFLDDTGGISGLYQFLDVL